MTERGMARCLSEALHVEAVQRIHTRAGRRADGIDRSRREPVVEGNVLGLCVLVAGRGDDERFPATT